MASNLRFIFKFLCVLFLTNCVQSTYISYYIQNYCDQHPDRRILISDEGQYSALILRSANGQTASNQTCKVKIIGQKIAGFVATVGHISLNSNKCEDYLEFDNSIKWCNQKDVNSVTIDKNEFDIEFGTGSNSSSQFELVITTFTGIWNRTCPKTNNVRCQGGKQECVYNGFECDGYVNCPLGSDEKGCPTATTQISDDAEGADILLNSNQTSYQVDTTTETPIYNSSTTTNSSITTNSSTSTNSSITTNSSTTMNSSTTTESSITTANETQTSPLSTTLKPTEQSTTFRTTANFTTQTLTPEPSDPTSNPNKNISGGGTAILIIIIIMLVALAVGSGIYIYKKQNEVQQALYSPL